MLKELNLFQKTWLNESVYFVVSLVFIFVINQNATLAQELHASNAGPAYPGGKNALKEFINKNLKYPDEAGKIGLSDVVEVKFMVDSEGKLGNIEVIKGISPECDAEAIRLTGMLDDWTPGMRQGKPVNTFVCLLIEFKGGKKIHPTVITGKIVEKTTGLPLSGILVIVKGTNIGTVSGPDGSYRLEVPSNANSLEYFGTGYSLKEVEIDFHSTINIELDPEYLIIDLTSQDN